MADRIYTFDTQRAEEKERIDKYLARMCPDYTRSYLQNLIRGQAVLVNGQPVKSNYRLCGEDKVSLAIPDAAPVDIEPEDLALDVLYEDEDVILINKPKRMVVHPAPGHMHGTLVNGLLYHCRGGLSGINGVLRPGIVHRIDQDTTGVLIACKNDRAHQCVAEQLKQHTITRRYQAIVYNHFSQPEGTVDAPVGRHPVDRKKMAVIKNGRNAVTHYQVVEELSQNFTYLRCRLETGRTHQIRVHMAYIGHPLLGDTIYGPSKSKYHLEGQTLHAGVLGFIHPRTGEYIEVEAPLPEYFEALLLRLRGAQEP